MLAATMSLSVDVQDLTAQLQKLSSPKKHPNFFSTYKKNAENIRLFTGVAANGYKLLPVLHSRWVT